MAQKGAIQGGHGGGISEIDGFASDGVAGNEACELRRTPVERGKIVARAVSVARVEAGGGGGAGRQREAAEWNGGRGTGPTFLDRAEEVRGEGVGGIAAEDGGEEGARAAGLAEAETGLGFEKKRGRFLARLEIVVEEQHGRE